MCAGSEVHLGPAVWVYFPALRRIAAGARQFLGMLLRVIALRRKSKLASLRKTYYFALMHPPHDAFVDRAVWTGDDQQRTCALVSLCLIALRTSMRFFFQNNFCIVHFLS